VAGNSAQDPSRSRAVNIKVKARLRPPSRVRRAPERSPPQPSDGPNHAHAVPVSGPLMQSQSHAAPVSGPLSSSWHSGAIPGGPQPTGPSRDKHAPDDAFCGRTTWFAIAALQLGLVSLIRVQIVGTPSQHAPFNNFPRPYTTHAKRVLVTNPYPF